MREHRARSTSERELADQETHPWKEGLTVTTLMPEGAAAPAASVTPARTWSFTNRHTGEPQTVTCLAGCTVNHASDVATPTYPEDIWCWTLPQDMTLPVNTDGRPEEFRVLSTVIKVEPYSPRVAQRLPYATIELVDDHFVEGLDPDGLETVINTLAARLDQMRETHAKLVRVRAEYLSR